MTFLIALALGIALLTTPSSVAWAEEPTSCENFPAGSLSRIECERNASPRQQRRLPEERTAQPSNVTPPVIQECGRRGEVSDQTWVACVDGYFRRLNQMEEERRRRAQQLQEQQRQEAERQWRIDQEERRTRALEEAAQAQGEQAEAQRQQAETAGRARTCKIVGYDVNGPIVECYYPNIPATGYGQ